jgi:hypothetical protein
VSCHHDPPVFCGELDDQVFEEIGRGAVEAGERLVHQ